MVRRHEVQVLRRAGHSLAETAKLVEERAIEMGHARALLGLTDRRKQSEVAALIARKGISVRETEALVRRMMQPAAERDSDAAGAAGHKDPNILSLQNDLSAKLGATVDIQHSRARGKGKVVISYNSLDELDGILDHIK